MHQSQVGEHALAAELQRGGSDAVLDGIAARAAESCQTPIGLVTVVGERIQVFVGASGLPGDLERSRASNRSASFCQFVIEDGQAVEIEDVRVRFGNEHPFVKHYDIEMYSGAAVRVRGVEVGALCVLDFVPRKMTDAQRKVLVELAAIAGERLEARLRIIELTNRTALARVRSSERMLLEELVKIRDIFARLAATLRSLGLGEGDLMASDLFNHAIRLEPMRRELVWAFDRVSEALTQVWALGVHKGNDALRDEAAALNARAGEAFAIFRLFSACLEAKISSSEFYRNVQLLSRLTEDANAVHARFDALVDSLVIRAA